MRERSSIMCKIFQDFQRWQNGINIVDNTERHNSVDNGLYRRVRPMEDNTLHPGHEPLKRHGDFTRKTLEIHISLAIQAYK